MMVFGAAGAVKAQGFICPFAELNRDASSASANCVVFQPADKQSSLLSRGGVLLLRADFGTTIEAIELPLSIVGELLKAEPELWHSAVHQLLRGSSGDFYNLNALDLSCCR